MKLIDKDALVAEIEKRISRNKERKEWEDIPEKRHQLIIEGQLLGELKHFLDTLEAKEVDLEKEIKKVQRKYKTIEEYKGYPCTMYANNIEWIAKHFFELGLKSKSSYVSTPSIDDTLKEMNIDPDSKLAKSFKEFYYTALEKFIVQKGEYL